MDDIDNFVGCGMADCIPGSKEMGIIYAKGVYEKGEFNNTDFPVQAYDMGKSVK